MHTDNHSGYLNTLGMRLLESAMQNQGPIFTMKQIKPIAKNMGVSDTHLRFLISSLSHANKIEIIKQGTYVITSPIFTEDISPYAIAAALVNPMAIGYWSACAYHGFTTQTPVMIQAATPKKVVTPEMRKKNVETSRPRGRAVWKAYGQEYEFVNVKQERFWGHEKIWVSSWHQVNITDQERTALDMVVRSDLFGGISAAMDLLENALAQISVNRLVQYAQRYNDVRAIKRLGWTLEKLGVPDSELAELIEYHAKGYYKLDIGQSSDNAPKNDRWHVIENLHRGK
jgi:predicted transcriptional regulator of viral defense system